MSALSLPGPASSPASARRRTLAVVVAASAALALAACGDDEHVAVDAGVTPDGSGNPDGPDLRARRVAAVAGDFTSTGVLSVVDAPSLAVQRNVAAGVASSDPVVRAYGDELFIVNRFGADNVTILDATTLQLVDQISTGAGSNPQDVAVVGDTLYVAALDTAGVLVIDRATPTQIDTVDLSALDDDGLPDCVSAYAVGTRVFVACGLLDSFAVVEPGTIAVIDTTDDTLATTVTMPAGNPTGFFERAPAGGAFDGDLLIGTVPDFVDYSTGCLVRVSTGATPTATCGPTNQALAGYVNRVAIGDDAAWAAVTSFDAQFNGAGALVRVDLATGTAGAALTPTTQVIQDVASCGQYVFATDKAAGADGLRVFDTGGTVTELTTAPLDLGLPPSFGSGLACIPAPL